MPRTRNKIIQKQRVFEPNDHLGRKLKSMKEIREEIEKEVLNEKVEKEEDK